VADRDAACEQLSLYTLDGLNPSETSAFRAHLATCAVCQEDKQLLDEVVAALAHSAPPVSPAPEVRERLLASIRDHEPSRNVVEPFRPAQQTVRGRRGTTPLWGMFAAAAAVFVTIALVAEEVRLRRAAAESQSTLAVLTAPDLARIDLAGQPVAPDASGRVFWSRSQGLVFTASNLPAPSAGRTYQLWVVTAQAPISAGLLQPDSDGRVARPFSVPSTIPMPVAMAITIEPEGGVPAPTGEKYLVGTVQ
jgi:anti-sigma-K factor RskA